MAQTIGYVAIALGALFVVAWLYTIVRSLLPSSVSTIGDQVEAFVDQASFLAALTPAYLIARRRGDTAALDLLAKARVQAAMWDDPPVAGDGTAAGTSQAATVESLAAELAALKGSLKGTTP